MPWPHDALTDGEEIVTQFRPHWRLLFLPAAVTLVVVVGIVAVVRWVPGDGLADVLPIVGLLALSAWFAVRPFVDWFYTRYVLTTERLITRRGLVAREGVEIPLENITNVNFHQSIVERVLGSGDLLVESAGETGRSEFLDIPHPDRFQALLYKVRERRTLELKGLPPSGGDDDVAARLRRLEDLRRDGLVDEDEYRRKRAELLDEL